jgi:SAM-dependent methyltransferase
VNAQRYLRVRMRVRLSAYACEPNRGSECEAGLALGAGIGDWRRRRRVGDYARQQLIACGGMMATSDVKAPMSEAGELYLRILKQLIKEQVLESSTHILVVCGGVIDRDTLMRAGLTNCVISNLDSRQNASEFLPLEWASQDAEDLSYPDDEFEFCLVHEGLHHCRSPHTAIREMFRVAKRGLLIIEPVENIFTTLCVRVGIGQEYEHAAVYGNDCRFGGVRNTYIPNYVYRFSASEFRKTFLCLKPEVKLKCAFRFHLVPPWSALLLRKSTVRLISVTIMRPLLSALHRMLPRVFSNQIVTLVIKPCDSEALQPWLRREGNRIELNNDWFAERFAQH